MLTDDQAADKAAKLPHMRRLLDAIAEDPDCPLPYPFNSLALQAGFEGPTRPAETGARRVQVASLLRAVRRAGYRVRKAPLGEGAEAHRDYHLIDEHGVTIGKVYSPAELTCERVQVGTETVTRPVTVTTVEEIGEETVEVPVYEWRCGPVLAPEGDPVLDAEERGSQADPDRYDDAPR